MAATATPTPVLAEVSPLSFDAAVHSRLEDPRPAGEFLAGAKGGIALKLAGIARELPPDMTPEEAYLLGAADVARTLATHHEAHALETAVYTPH